MDKLSTYKFRLLVPVNLFKTLQLFSIFLLSYASLNAQKTRHLVKLTDKNGSTYSLNRPGEFLSAKSIERRQRQNIQLETTDLPVNAQYIQEIEALPGIEVLNVSKWLNSVVIKISDPSDLAAVHTLPYVDAIREIAAKKIYRENDLIQLKLETPYELPRNEIISGIKGSKGIQTEINYGSSFPQIHIHEGEFLHSSGFTGSGITIAMLDAGYTGYSANPAFDSIRLSNRILGGYDFVINQAVISQTNSHGTSCLSVIASNRPGQIVGSAPAASFWLLRTEDAASEYPVEEHNWASAAEFADSVGADIISSSLGYTTFDDPTMNYSYAMRDGNTGISTRAADLAARKGMIVINSAGNSGGLPGDERFISCPADGDSVVAIGAIRADMQIAGFSSWGPNANGKVKPNLVSIGQGTILANNQGNPVGGNGTSFSAPNISGLFACLWQAFPEFTNMEIINAVQQSADRYLQPDIRYGYGVPNFRIAYNSLLQQKIERGLDNMLQEDWIRTFPSPFYSSVKVVFKARTTGKVNLQIFDNLGRLYSTLTMDVISGQNYLTDQMQVAGLNSGIYYIVFTDDMGRKTLKTVKN